MKKISLLALFVILTAVLFYFFDGQQALSNFIDWIPSLGPAAPMVFILIYAFACVFFIPGSLLTLGAGALFGVIPGSVIVSMASTLGAALAFLTGRYFARDWIAQKVESNPKFAAIDRAVAREGWKIVGLTRLSPVFPFTLLNYAYGITKVSLKDYILASWIGMMPGTVMYVYLGAAAGSLAAADREKTAGEWVLFGVGLLATIAVTVYVTKLARRALAQKADLS